ncbi:hypothetical protein HU200_029544 [Digitaria exilis]|uniref:Cyclic nucleotide-binding domain-containing protein n=1 Tax=Digitaria exilis TaxID=1010633 RepID=A0A835BPT3_9POAL|nr:hypothetical protein HU200_029544 [Digitaria exilis]
MESVWDRNSAKPEYFYMPSWQGSGRCSCGSETWNGECCAAVTGDEEMEMIKDLPGGLRRDIKCYLCLELVKQVPLFHGMDDMILDNICDRLWPLLFSSGEKVIREGDPVPRMVFAGPAVHHRALSSSTRRGTTHPTGGHGRPSTSSSRGAEDGRGRDGAPLLAGGGSEPQTLRGHVHVAPAA